VSDTGSDSAADDAAEPAEAVAQEAVAEPTEAPTAVPTEEPTEEPDEPIELSDIDLDFSDFNTYHLVMQITFTGIDADGNEISEGVIIDSLNQIDPPAQLMTMTATGDTDPLGTGGDISMATIDGTMYMDVPEMGCVSLPAAEAGDVSAELFDTFSPSSMFDNADNLRRIRPNQEINGIQTRHYQFDESAFGADDDVTSATGDLYIAVDGGYLVRMVAEIQGGSDFSLSASDDVSDGTAYLEMNITDVNQPIEINLPEACAAQAEGAAYPVMDDATETSTFAGFISYKTSASVAEVVAFYEAEMAAAGYTADADSTMVTDQFASMTFSSDDTVVTLSASYDSDSESTTVFLAEE
jgi:hypothetical protein